jgi:hypothetical protein
MPPMLARIIFVSADQLRGFAAGVTGVNDFIRAQG